MEQYSREVFVQLGEVDFKEVPPFLEADLEEYATAMKSTLLIENMFNHLRKVERKSMTGKCMPKTAWHHFCHSSLLTDFDREAIAVTEPARQAAPSQIPNSTFSAVDEECSLTDEQLDTIHATQPSWPTLSPENGKMASLHWAIAMHLQGDWGSLEKAWQSLLLSPGTLVMQTGHSGSMVLRSCPYGFVAWKVGLERPEGSDKIHINFGVPSRSVLKYDAVVDCKAWKALDLICCPPRASAADGVHHPVRLSVVLSDKGVPLVEHSARRGFRGLTTHYLKKLFGLLSDPAISGKKPTTESDLVRSLAQLILGPLDAKALEAIFLARGRGGADDACEAVPIPETELDQVLEELEDEDLAQEIEKYKRSQERNKSRISAAKREAAKADVALDLAAAPSPASAAAKLPLKRVPGRGLTQAEAKEYFPPGCQVTKDITRHNRWQVRAPYLKPSHSKVFSARTEKSENEALLYCLQLAWHKRTILFGDVCPFDLDTALF